MKIILKLKRILFYSLFLISAIQITFSKKDSPASVAIVSPPPPPPVNRAPIANAGKDQIITLPNSTATLDASGYTDPDNNITSYVWVKIS